MFPGKQLNELGDSEDSEDSIAARCLATSRKFAAISFVHQSKSSSG
jgi:hypothetical protein